MSRFGGVPEQWKKEGIYVHGRDLVHPGDTVEAIRDVLGVIGKGTRLKIKALIVEPNDPERGFIKRLEFEGVEGVFNPNRFRKI